MSSRFSWFVDNNYFQIFVVGSLKKWIFIESFHKAFGHKLITKIFKNIFKIPFRCCNYSKVSLRWLLLLHPLFPSLKHSHVILLYSGTLMIKYGAHHAIEVGIIRDCHFLFFILFILLLFFFLNCSYTFFTEEYIIGNVPVYCSALVLV